MDNLAKFWARDKDATIIRIKEKFPNQVDESLRIADEVLANTFTFQDVWEMERSTDPVVFTGDITDIPWSYRPGASCRPSHGTQAWHHKQPSRGQATSWYRPIP